MIRRHLYPNEDAATEAAMMRGKASEEARVKAQSMRAAGVLKEGAGRSGAELGTAMMETAMLIEKGT